MKYPTNSMKQRAGFLGNLALGIAACLMCSTAMYAADTGWISYQVDGQLEAMPAGKASLYRVPWRSNVQTISGYEAAQGVGIYYKHIGGWSLAGNTNVMRQMVECGVNRLRLAPHFALYIHPEWTAPSDKELEELEVQFKASHAAGIRPCVTFVHVPAMGEGDELQKWFTRSWNKGLMPAGQPGSAEYAALLDKTYLAMRVILDSARASGFEEADSYDLEMGQNLWWGFPAMPPFPGLRTEMLRPGGQVYQFEQALMQRARADGYAEPTFWWGQSHHFVDLMAEEELPPEVAGRSVSIYSVYSGTVGSGWLGETQEAGVISPTDDWPEREPLTFLHPAPPEMVIARPESYMADFSRHDNLIQLMHATDVPVAVTSLGVVPESIPDWQAGGLNGWQLKSRGLTRSLAFWLNQGSPMVLLHSAYEGAKDENSHALMPNIEDPETMVWKDAGPLQTLHAFTRPLLEAVPVPELTEVRFSFKLSNDPVLIPAVDGAGPLKASDAIALLTYQLSPRKFAVAAYIVTPNIVHPLDPIDITLRVDKAVKGAVETIHPSTQTSGQAEIIEKSQDSVTVRFPIRDDVTWMIFETE